MKTRVQWIESLLGEHLNSFFVFGNGLTSREAVHFFRNSRSFYLLHGMGETLSIGIGIALARPDLEVVVVDGDGSAQMGMASWAMMPVRNLTYYVLENGVHETTGGQKLPPFPLRPEWCNFLPMSVDGQSTPNPPAPTDLLKANLTWLNENRGI